MNPAWFVRPDWPMDWEIQRRTDLMDAIRGLPGGASLSNEDAEGKALWLWSASLSGRDEEAPRNRPASQKASEEELAKLADLAARLADHLDALHRPAVDALWIETNGSLWNAAECVKDLAEAARCALSAVAAPASARGAPEKVEARHVRETAQLVFEAVAGWRATVTKSPDGGYVSGDWPAFLDRVFTILAVDAKARSQAAQSSK